VDVGRYFISILLPGTCDDDDDYDYRYVHARYMLLEKRKGGFEATCKDMDLAGCGDYIK